MQEQHHQFQVLYGRPLDSENQTSLPRTAEQPPKRRSYFLSTEEDTEHARLRETMEETQQQQQQQQGRGSRLGLRHAGGGEIVEVQGGHIVRSIGRKDRHSKVCTAKGPRDRRVRLAAHTAIQFYDVQDRLGYDRPSKAVDWLIKKAKSAIDELEQLPAWNPTSGPAGDENLELNQDHGGGSPVDDGGGSSMADTDRSSSMQNQMSNNNAGENHNSFFPMSGIESGNIADTIKSFFPVGASAGTSSSTEAMQFQGFPPPGGLLSRTGSHAQDLRLSLQSLQDPILLNHHHNQNHQHPPPQNQSEHQMFTGGFETPSGGWSENQQAEITRIQRMLAWNPGGDSGGGGGFLFNSPPTPPLFSGNNNQFVSQRGPLQSSNTQQIRAWIDHPSSVTVASGGGDHHHHHYHHQALPIHPSSLSFGGSMGGGFPGFYIPARVQGEQQEEHGGVSDKPSSASSDSRH